MHTVCQPYRGKIDFISFDRHRGGELQTDIKCAGEEFREIRRAFEIIHSEFLLLVATSIIIWVNSDSLVRYHLLSLKIGNSPGKFDISGQPKLE